MPDSAAGTKKLGRYDILRVLGKGAMGVVYEALDPNLNRKVAIKTVRVDSLPKDEVDEYELRFRTEAHSAARLQHPNIVSVYDSDRDGNTPFLVMEFVKGEDLKHYLDSGQRYTLEQSVRIMRDLLAALDYAHQHKIIHRDIKPANLLIEANGRVKLTDFGVARIQDSGEATKTQGGMVGTLKYMSPEQVEGKSVGAASDIFSAGVVLYQLLTDRRPFDGDSYFSIVNQITNQNPPAPSSINQMLPAAVDAVVARALAKSKTERFATAQDFAAALQAAARRADPTITPSANPYKTIEQLGTGAHERSGSTASITSATSGTSGSTITQELELVYWKDVKESNDIHDLEGFLKRFPDGVYSDLAKRQLKRIADTKLAQGEALYDSTQIAAIQKSEQIELADDITMLRRPDPVKNLQAIAHKNEHDLETTAPMANRPSQDLEDTIPQPLGSNTLESATPSLPVMPPGLQATAYQLEDTQIKMAMQAPSSKELSSATSELDKPKPKRSMAGLIVGAAVMAFIAIGTWLWMAVAKAPDVKAPTVVAMTPTATVTAVVVAPIEPASSPFSQLEAATVSVLITNSSSVASPLTTEQTNTNLPALTSSPSQSTISATTTAVKTPKLAASTAKATKAQREASATQSGQQTNQTNKVTNTTANSSMAPSNPVTAASAPPTPKPVATTPSNPREACEGRVLFGFVSCLTEQCNKSNYQNHPICIERREQEERRKASELNR